MNKQLLLSIGLMNGLKFVSKLDNADELPSNSKVWTCSGMSILFGEYCLHTVENNDAYAVSTCKPIIRPISDLTKEITQANYNDGNPFIPIVELAKIHFMDISWTGNFNIDENGKVQFDSYESFCSFWFDERMKTFCFECSDFTYEVPRPLELFQLLWYWHFAPGLDEDVDVVDVTDEFNPYK
jgi:hypothetical protein